MFAVPLLFLFLFLVLLGLVPIQLVLRLEVLLLRQERFQGKAIKRMERKVRGRVKGGGSKGKEYKVGSI